MVWVSCATLIPARFAAPVTALVLPAGSDWVMVCERAIVGSGNTQGASAADEQCHAIERADGEVVQPALQSREFGVVVGVTGVK